MLTVKQAAHRLGISIKLMYELVASKAIAHFRVGAPGKRGKVLLAEDDLEAYLQACKVPVQQRTVARKPFKSRFLD